MLWDWFQLDFFNYIDSCTIQVVVDELLKLSLKSIEGNNDTSHVVNCPSKRRGPENGIDTMTTVLVSVIRIHFLYLFFVGFHYHFLPGDVDAVLARELVKHTVTSYDDEIVVVFNLKCCNVWVCHYYLWITLILLKFGLNISDCPRNR